MPYAPALSMGSPDRMYASIIAGESGAKVTRVSSEKQRTSAGTAPPCHIATIGRSTERREGAKCGAWQVRVKTIPEHKRNPAVHGMRGSAERCEPARAAATGVSVRVRPNDHSRALAHHARSHEAAERSAGFWAWARTFPRREHGHGASRGSCPRAPPPCRPR